MGFQRGIKKLNDDGVEDMIISDVMQEFDIEMGYEMHIIMQ